MTEGDRTAAPYGEASTKGQPEGRSGVRRQIEALLGWPDAESEEVLVGQLGVELVGSGRNSYQV